MANESKPSYQEEVLKKYDINSNLVPGVTEFGPQYGKTRMDLSSASVGKIDAFCDKYPNNPYFKLKKGTAAPAKSA